MQGSNFLGLKLLRAQIFWGPKKSGTQKRPGNISVIALKCGYVIYDDPIVTLHARTKRGRFPDSKAKILGRAAKSIPNKLTT